MKGRDRVGGFVLTKIGALGTEGRNGGPTRRRAGNTLASGLWTDKRECSIEDTKVTTQLEDTKSIISVMKVNWLWRETTASHVGKERTTRQFIAPTKVLIRTTGRQPEE